MTETEKDIQVAQMEVDQSTARLDKAFDHLKSKVNQGAQKVDRMMAPLRYVRQHPTEFGSLLAFAAFFLLGGFMSRRRSDARRRQAALIFFRR